MEKKNDLLTPIEDKISEGLYQSLDNILFYIPCFS